MATVETTVTAMETTVTTTMTAAVATATARQDRVGVVDALLQAERHQVGITRHGPGPGLFRDTGIGVGQPQLNDISGAGRARASQRRPEDGRCPQPDSNSHGHASVELNRPVLASRPVP
jgi:hypothetical protein